MPQSLVTLHSLAACIGMPSAQCCIHVHLAMFMRYSAIHAILLVGRVYLQKDAHDQLPHRFVCQNSLNQLSRADTCQQKRQASVLFCVNVEPSGDTGHIVINCDDYAAGDVLPSVCFAFSMQV